MRERNPSHLFPHTEKQRAASRRNHHIGTEASKKKVGYIDEEGITHVFESKRKLIRHLNITYDVLNYRLKTGKMYNNLSFFEVKNDN